MNGDVFSVKQELSKRLIEFYKLNSKIDLDYVTFSDFLMKNAGLIADCNDQDKYNFIFNDILLTKDQSDIVVLDLIEIIVYSLKSLDVFSIIYYDNIGHINESRTNEFLAYKNYYKNMVGQLNLSFNRKIDNITMESVNDNLIFVLNLIELIELFQGYKLKIGALITSDLTDVKKLFEKQLSLISI